MDESKPGLAADRPPIRLRWNDATCGLQAPVASRTGPVAMITDRWKGFFHLTGVRSKRRTLARTHTYTYTHTHTRTRTDSVKNRQWWEEGGGGVRGKITQTKRACACEEQGTGVATCSRDRDDGPCFNFPPRAGRRGLGLGCVTARPRTGGRGQKPR
jgi:hypothetical protein